MRSLPFSSNTKAIGGAIAFSSKKIVSLLQPLSLLFKEDEERSQNLHIDFSEYLRSLQKRRAMDDFL
ncbi:hypothetical protein H6G64_30395 [Calothrix sp. FACHB-156]|nr:hypothetical protein [Calothrix sp. FACHB-156]